MKKLIILAAVGAILVGGYATLWHQNADHLKNDVEAEIANLNNKIGDEPISYSSINTSGFPGSLTVNLKDAKFHQADRITAYTDIFHIARGIISNSFTTQTGDLSFTFPPLEGEENPTKLLVKSKSNDYAEVTFKDSQLMNFINGKLSMSPIEGKELDWKEVVEHFRSYVSSNSGFRIINENTGKDLITSGPTSSKFVVERLSPVSHKIDLQLSIVNQEFTPEFDQMLQTLARRFAKVTGNKASDLYLLKLSSAGKTDLKLNASYKGLTDFSAKNLEPWQSQLNVSQFDYSNRLQTGTMQGSLLVKSKENDKDNKPKNLEGEIDFKGTYLASPEMKDYFKKAYTDMAEILAANPPQDSKDEEEYQLELKIAQFMAKHTDTIFPDMAMMGKMKYGMDLKFNEAQKSILLNDLFLDMTNYGFAMKGDGNFANQQNPKGAFDISLKNYELMISDLVDYTVKIAQVVKEESEGKMNIDLNPDFKKKLIAFLKTVSTTPKSDQKDIIIKISFDGDQVKVGHMDGNQALVNFMMMLGAS